MHELPSVHTSNGLHSLTMSDFKCKFDENLLGISRMLIARGFHPYKVVGFADDVEEEGEFTHRSDGLSENIDLWF